MFHYIPPLSRIIFHELPNPSYSLILTMHSSTAIFCNGWYSCWCSLLLGSSVTGSTTLFLLPTDHDIRFLHSNNFQSHCLPLPNLHILKRQSTSQSPEGWWTLRPFFISIRGWFLGYLYVGICMYWYGKIYAEAFPYWKRAERTQAHSSYFWRKLKMDPGHVSSFVTTNKNFFIDIIHMALLEIIIRAKLVRYNYEYLVYYVCKKQSNMCSRLILLCVGIRVYA